MAGRPVSRQTARHGARAGARVNWRAGAVGLVALAALITVAAVSVSSGSPRHPSGRGGPGRAKGAVGATAGRGANSGKPATRARMAGAVVAPPAVEPGVMPWLLQAPISREVVLPGAAPGQLLVAGGLASGGTSVASAYKLTTGSGALSLAGNLVAATHDAAAVQLGPESLIFGGGTTAPTAVAQGFSAAGVAEHLPPLPAARADAAATVMGGTAYVVGGYSGGTSLDGEVLATTNGASYRDVARLPVPVRYPAVAALHGLVYVFGGESGAGVPVGTVQAVDPATGVARVVGHLPVPLSAAAAGVLGGTVYLAGGVSGSPAEPVSSIYAFVPARGTFLLAGQLPVAVANAGATVSGGRMWLVGGEMAGGVQTAEVQFVKPDRAFGTAGAAGAGSPFFGDRLLIADRGNDRLLLVDSAGRILWAYPSSKMPPPPSGFYFPDDAFFIRHGTAIISNQEENDTLVEIAYPSGRVIWSYGHTRTPGSAPGYLNMPDDAYLMRNGDITVADPMNCRVLIIDPTTKAVLHQIGTTGVCAHKAGVDLGSPNGDTPLADGNLLVSEIDGSWVDEYTTTGKYVWGVKLPIGYPSDAQQIGPDRYLVADYEAPGAIVEFNRAGQVLYRFQPTSGPSALNHPSLVELLPSGVFLMNDDYNDRIVAIDPTTGAVVWQYGHTAVPGTAPGYLNTPDGFDVLGPGGVTPTHTATG